MTRGDAIGLWLVLLAGIAGITWVAAEGRKSAAPPPPNDTDPVAALGAPSGSRRVPVGPLRATEPQGQVDARWSELNLEAIAALKAGDFDRAIELFERCRAGVPEEPVFQSNLAEALARLATRRHEDRESRGEAIELLARAVDLAPERPELAQLLAQWRKVAETEEGFWTDESEHFVLSYDGEREDLLHRGYYQLLNELESAYLEFGELFGRFPVEAGRAKIQVVLYRREEFAALTGIGHWAGGVFDGVVRIPVEDLDRERPELLRVLRHELVHAFVTEIGGRDVPGWLNEGLAQWLEPSFLDERSRRVEEARRSLSPDALFPLERLAGSLAKWTDVDAIRSAYAESLALVGLLVRFYGERVVFEMVEGSGEGRSCEDTFRARTGVDLATIVEDLARGL